MMEALIMFLVNACFVLVLLSMLLLGSGLTVLSFTRILRLIRADSPASPDEDFEDDDLGELPENEDIAVAEAKTARWE